MLGQYVSLLIGGGPAETESDARNGSASLSERPKSARLSPQGVPATQAYHLRASPPHRSRTWILGHLAHATSSLTYTPSLILS
jgi:hypothetical protein